MHILMKEIWRNFGGPQKKGIVELCSVFEFSRPKVSQSTHTHSLYISCAENPFGECVCGQSPPATLGSFII